MSKSNRTSGPPSSSSSQFCDRPRHRAVRTSVAQTGNASMTSRSPLLPLPTISSSSSLSCLGGAESCSSPGTPVVRVAAAQEAPHQQLHRGRQSQPPQPSVATFAVPKQLHQHHHHQHAGSFQLQQLHSLDDISTTFGRQGGDDSATMQLSTATNTNLAAGDIFLIQFSFPSPDIIGVVIWLLNFKWI